MKQEKLTANAEFLAKCLDYEFGLKVPPEIFKGHLFPFVAKFDAQWDEWHAKKMFNREYGTA